jgi:hypothetical protein
VIINEGVKIIDKVEARGIAVAKFFLLIVLIKIYKFMQD